MQNVFTRNSLAEVEFQVHEIRMRPGGGPLELGCGTGWYVIELAHRAYRVVGVDLSRGMPARSAAQAAGVVMDWIQTDTKRFAAPAWFDGALCLCEGAFGLTELDEDPMKPSPATWHAACDRALASCSPPRTA
jgi:SAM-dependent methyltransferase